MKEGIEDYLKGLSIDELAKLLEKSGFRISNGRVLMIFKSDKE